MQMYSNQIALEKQMQGYYSAEMDAYAAEMVKFAQTVGKDSNEYRAAQAAYEGMNEALIQSKQNAIDLKRQMLDLNLKPMDYALNRLKAGIQQLQDVLSLKQARGTMYNNPASAITEADYSAQIRNANSQIVELEKRAQYNRAVLATMDYNVDSEAYDQLKSAIEADEHAINELYVSNEGLKDSIRELRWKPFKDMQKELDNATEDIEHIRSLLNNEGFFDDNGEGWEFTEEGIANISLLGVQIEKARDRIADYHKALEKVDDEYKKGNISLEERNEYTREYEEKIQSLVNSTKQYKNELIELYKTQITNENNALIKNIELRKESLATMRSYYDYSRQLRDKNKSRNEILSQINSLQGATNIQDQAQLARLREQLSQSEDELADTRYSHRMDLLSQGYDKLEKDANDTLDKTLKMVSANADMQESIVAAMLQKVGDNYKDTYNNVIAPTIQHTGTVVSETATKCLEDPELNNFFTTIDTKTGIPMDNWKSFVSEVAKSIDTTTIDTFTTHTNQQLDTSITKAKELANALANKTADDSNKGNTNGTPKGGDQPTGSGNTGGGNTGGGGTDAATYDKMATDALNAVKAASQDYTKNNAKSWKSASALIKTANVNRNSMSEAGKAALEKAYEISNRHTDLLTTNNAFVKYLQKEGKATKSITSKANDFREYLVTNFGYDLGNYDDNYAKYNILATKIKGGAGVRKIDETAAAFMKRLLTELRGYSKGTLGTKYNEINWTHAGEIIRRSDGAILRQLPKGTQVVPKIESENLMKWAQIDPFKELKESMSNTQNINNGGNQQQTIYYENLINIQGNVDADMLDRVEQLGTALLKSRNFMQKQFNYNSKEFNRELKKLH